MGDIEGGGATEKGGMRRSGGIGNCRLTRTGSGPGRFRSTGAG